MGVDSFSLSSLASSHRFPKFSSPEELCYVSLTNRGYQFIHLNKYTVGRVPRIIVALVATLLIGHVGIGIAVAVKIANGGIVTIAGRVADWLCLASYTSATLADILLSGTIIHAVRHSRANHQEKDAYIDVFLLYVINTGLLTGICNAIGTIMVGVKFSNNIRATAFNFVVCRLYANTLLSVLNSRKLLLSRGMEILDGKVLGRNFLARANHLAMAERWNVPESGQHNNEIPIMVNVSAETQTDQSDAIGEKRGKLEPNRRSSTSTD
ncbi:hypothetical protein C8Q78DRAFT_1081783 [Trametes maxima]|nr:hypothetical protein C8Q78DRAFT_1081783 [Trametes maxima]